MTSRERRKQFLLAEIESLEDAPDPDKELLKVLYETVDGLDNLDLGQADEIFAVADVQSWGQLPATAKRYKAHAIGYVLLLKEMGVSIANAEGEVANRYGIEANNLRQWRKIIGKSTDPRLREIIRRSERQFKNLQRLNHPPSLEGVLAEITKAGEIFKAAIAKKSVKKFK
jgi:transposase-like protein